MRSSVPHDEDEQLKLLKKMKYVPVELESEGWAGISEEARQFICNLLDSDPMNRMTALLAPDHPRLQNPSTIPQQIFGCTLRITK